MTDPIHPLTTRASETALRVVETVKPELRGWLHAGTFPLAVAAGTVLVVLAPAGRVRVACAVFAVTAALLFGVSGLYHRCLLYTSDAADEEDSVDLGGRRIIKK